MKEGDFEVWIFSYTNDGEEIRGIIITIIIKIIELFRIII